MRDNNKFTFNYPLTLDNLAKMWRFVSWLEGCRVVQGNPVYTLCELYGWDFANIRAIMQEYGTLKNFNKGDNECW